MINYELFIQAMKILCLSFTAIISCFCSEFLCCCFFMYYFSYKHGNVTVWLRNLLHNHAKHFGLVCNTSFRNVYQFSFRIVSHFTILVLFFLAEGILSERLFAFYYRLKFHQSLVNGFPRLETGRSPLYM